MTRVVLVLVATLLAACASGEPAAPSAFDSSFGKLRVVVAADGFVRCDDQRVPLEAAVLTLRQRTRAMDEDQIARFVVEVATEPAPVGSPEAANMRVAVNRFLDELQVMGVRQVVCQ
ncbi:MAG: hypothetical protein JNK78_08740 [Planctomycetes bacterium]|nr:hypothetical protein [Planctomycetota bacterium]